MSTANPNDLGAALKRLTVVDWLLCIFCGCIAIIVGIVAIVKGDTMRGVLMIVIPFLIGIVLTILQVILGVGAAAVGGGPG